METIIKSFTKKGISKLPKKPGVYKAIDKDGEVIYVGKAKANRLKPRLQEHISKKDLPGTKKVLIKTTKTENDALRKEKTEIIKHKPKHNTIYNSKRKK